MHTLFLQRVIGVARGGQRGHAPPKLLENMVILCFEKCFSKQNRVIRQKSNILAPSNCTTFALLQPLQWCCVHCVIHHERDVREE